MEGWQRAFVLRSRPWSETSLMLGVSTEELGHARPVAESAHSKCLALKGALQPFISLSLCFGRRDEAKALRNAEAVSLALPLNGVTLYSGLYIDELLSRVLEYETRFSKLFFDYLYCIQSLAGATDMPELALCHSEPVLFGHLGYDVNLTRCAGSGEPIDDTMTYRYREEKGLIASVAIGSKMFTGKQLKALDAQEFPNTDTPCAAKRFTRVALRSYLSGKPLENRGLLRQFMLKRTVKAYYE